MKFQNIAESILWSRVVHALMTEYLKFPMNYLDSEEEKLKIAHGILQSIYGIADKSVLEFRTRSEGIRF